MNIAIVSHEYGCNGYKGETLDELNKNICQEFVALWFTEHDKNTADMIGMYLEQKNWFRAIQLYFEEHPSDNITYAVA